MYSPLCLRTPPGQDCISMHPERKRKQTTLHPRMHMYGFVRMKLGRVTSSHRGAQRAFPVAALAVCQELGPGPSTRPSVSPALQVGRPRLWGLGRALGTQDE